MRPTNIFPTLQDFHFDGRAILDELFKASPWGSAEQAIASLTVFAHPDAVMAVQSRAVFCTIRDNSRKFSIADGVMLDDNTSPQFAFKYATGFKPGPFMTCCHIYSQSKSREHYTDLRNIMWMPSSIHKLSDSQKKIPEDGHLLYLLQRRSFELYGYLRPDGSEPANPPGYETLFWSDPIGRGATKAIVQAAIIKRLDGKAHFLSRACRELGWTFSDYLPDARIRVRNSN